MVDLAFVNACVLCCDKGREFAGDTIVVERTKAGFTGDVARRTDPT